MKRLCIFLYLLFNNAFALPSPEEAGFTPTEKAAVLQRLEEKICPLVDKATFVKEYRIIKKRPDLGIREDIIQDALVFTENPASYNCEPIFPFDIKIRKYLWGASREVLFLISGSSETNTPDIDHITFGCGDDKTDTYNTLSCPFESNPSQPSTESDET